MPRPQGRRKRPATCGKVFDIIHLRWMMSRDRGRDMSRPYGTTGV